MGQKIKILLVEPGKAPRPATVNSTIEEVEGMLGGPAQLGCFLPQRVMLVSRQNTEGLVPNRRMPGKKESIRGTFLLCGIPEEGGDFASLSQNQMEEFRSLFARPGEFMEIGGALYSDPDDVADAAYQLWETLADGESVTFTKRGNASLQGAVG